MKVQHDLMAHRTRTLLIGVRSAHRAIEDADRFDVLVDRILDGRGIEEGDVPRRLRACLVIAALLARYRIERHS